MKCEICGAAINPFATKKTGRKYLIRCSECDSKGVDAPARPKNQPVMRSDIMEIPEKAFRVKVSNAVCLTIEGEPRWQASSWFGRDLEDALRYVRHSLSVEYKGKLWPVIEVDDG